MKSLIRKLAVLTAAGLCAAAVQAEGVRCPPPLPYPETSAAIAHPQGLLWRVSRGGVPPSYLFGTIHLADPRVTTLPAEVARAAREARLLLVELELHPQSRTQLRQASVLARDDPSLAQRDPALFDLLAQIAGTEFGLQRDELTRLKPWALFTLLSRPRHQPGPVLDQVLQEAAALRGQPVRGLETAAELIAVLDGISTADQLEILRDTLCEFDTVKEQITALTKHYLARDLAAMWAWHSRPRHNEAVYARFITRILTRRNERMLDRLVQHLANGGVFVAVGALHLPGPTGLLEGVTRLGYQVEAVY